MDSDPNTATSSSTTTTTSNDDVDNSDYSTKISLPELDSGLSEAELCQARTNGSIPSKLNRILAPPPPPSSSDVESGFSGDCSPHGKTSSSPFTLQHQSSIDMNDIPTLERIALELNSIALDWRSYHAPVHCACSLPFDSAQRKVGRRKTYPIDRLLIASSSLFQYNCWRCGENFCIRCIERSIHLPGLYSNSLAPVCKICARSIKSSPSFADFSALVKSKSSDFLRNQAAMKLSRSMIDQFNNHR